MQINIGVLFAFFMVVAKVVNGVDFFWRNYNGTVPIDALPTRHGTYIGQIIAGNCGNIPGTLYPDKQMVTTMAGEKVIKTKMDIKILCSREPERFRWEQINTDSLVSDYMPSCLQGGFEGDPVYIGKIFHENRWKIGKVFPLSSRWKGLNVWRTYKDVSYHIQDFEILRFT